MFKRAHHLQLPSQQTGITLIVGLIMLLLLTMIGVSGIQDTNMQERMASNVRDKNLALQGAETALRDAENSLKGASLGAFDDSNGYLKDGTNARPYDAAYLAGDTSPAFNWNLGKTTPDYDDNLHSQPRWIVEHLSSDICNSAGGSDSVALKGPQRECDKYRITARSYGMTSNTQAILQTTVRR